MTQTNLFLANTPLQLICAQEARDKFCKGERNHLLVLRRGTGESPVYRKTVLEIDDGWTRVTHVHERTRRGPGRSLNRLWWTLVILARHGPVRGKVFLASAFRDWHSTLARLFGREVTWIDDGTSSIGHLNRFSGSAYLSSPNHTTPKFFTIFGTAELERESNGAIVQNMLSARRTGQESRLTDPGKVWFLGQPISQIGALSEEEELALLEKIFEEVGRDKTIVYVPHGAEKDDKLDRISRFCALYRPYFCVESALNEVEKLPVSVMSWCSTGLFTINLLFPQIVVSAVQIPYDGTPKEKCEQLERVYRHYAQFGIPIWFRDR